MSEGFSVLMSLYIKEKPQYVRQCFESLLKQTVPASEWVIVEDGPLTQEMYQILDKYQREYPNLINRIPLKFNQGLGNALRVGIKHCKFELIARMDTDDIARSDRFEKQLDRFREQPNLDICGSHIIEFDGSPDNILSRRKVPLEEAAIYKYQRRRDSFNHMTVMYKKSTVLKAGNYQDALLMEDSLLWINMMKIGAKCANIDDYLVYVRTGSDMFSRRGGIGYFRKYLAGRKKIYKTKYISWFDYVYTIFLQLIISIMPNSIRKKIYIKFLR